MYKTKQKSYVEKRRANKQQDIPVNVLRVFCYVISPALSRPLHRNPASFGAMVCEPGSTQNTERHTHIHTQYIYIYRYTVYIYIYILYIYI